jgi:hypothetical protein
MRSIAQTRRSMPELDASMIARVASAGGKWTRESFALVSEMYFESEPNTGETQGKEMV